MEYRTNRRTGDRISVIGLGTSYICDAPESQAIAALEYAFKQGINYADLATGGAKTFEYYGKALGSVRDRMHYQIHFGADYTKDGKYGWSTDPDTVKRSLSMQLENLKTDYIDYGFIHCIDEEKDWQKYQDGGILQYLLDMKAQGVVKHIGMSTHNPALGNIGLDTGLLDMLMFSINPAYDHAKGEFANGSAAERMELYRRCEKEGVGISVMKPFSGGQLLDKARSPFGRALTRSQCIQYALDKPGVLTVLPGMASVENVKELIAFFDASDEERDYSVLGELTPRDEQPACVYCNHCAPCPMGLNVALINKYYDLARMGDSMAVDHYKKLDVRADGCVKCGHCESRCPFSVKQEERMSEIADYFAKLI